MRTFLKRVIWGILILILLTTIGFVAWASFPLGPGQTAQLAIQSDERVTVETIQEWTVFRPAAGVPQTGFIFYPGGRVDYRSYAPLLKPLAEHGYLVVLTPHAALNGNLCTR